MFIEKKVFLIRRKRVSSFLVSTDLYMHCVVKLLLVRGLPPCNIHNMFLCPTESRVRLSVHLSG